MKNLKWITYLNLVLYGLFICLNLVELIWNSNLYSWGPDLHTSGSSFFMKAELLIHDILNIVATVAIILFLMFCNYFVKKNELGKSYHFLLVLLGFFPIANYFLLFIIWRKLNQSLFNYFGMSYKSTDRLIVLLWVLELSYVLCPTLITIAQYYSHNPELVMLVSKLTILGPIARSVYLFVISVFYVSYFIGFKKGMKKSESGVRDMIENELID